MQPGSADGKLTAARFNQPSGISVDKIGNLFVSDYYNHTIRKISPLGEVTTIAGKAPFQSNLPIANFFHFDI
jgi:hypothetical protein